VTRASDAWFSDWAWVRYFFGEGEWSKQVRRIFQTARFPCRSATPACNTHASHPCIVYVDIYNYFRTALESFEPLISRVGQTIRCPLRIQIKWPRIKCALCASQHIATTASLLRLLPANVICLSYNFISNITPRLRIVWYILCIMWNFGWIRRFRFVHIAFSNRYIIQQPSGGPTGRTNTHSR